LALIIYVAVQAGVDVRAVPKTVAQPIVTATASATAAAAMPADTAENTVDAALYEQGKQVYLSQYCGVCHTLAAAGTAGMFGPAHDGIVRHANDRIADPRYKGGATTAAEYIHESIVDPSVFIAAGGGYGAQAMPPFGHLPATDIDALVYFLSQQR
jgi:mono/diheme cytochrome c family protein